MHGKYSEYITSDMAKNYVVFGGPYVNKNYFKVDDRSQWKEVSFAEFLMCGGRGFFSLRCAKCKADKYNGGIGFCDGCSSTGVLGAHCLKCNTGEIRPNLGEVKTFNYMHVK